MRWLIKFACVAFFVAILTPADAFSQETDMSPRFGIGTGAVLSTEDGIGLNLHGRASAPINQDVSVGVDLGFTGYILGGTANAVTVFDPQLSAIVNLPMTENVIPYLIGGVGAHVPVTQADRSVSGPTLHLGIGRVQPLEDTSLYYEVNPAILISEEQLNLIVPVRIGIIFR